MKNIFLLLFFPPLLFSQVNFSEDISSIIYNNCTECHRDGQAGAAAYQALDSYESIASQGGMIKYVTQEGIMPPWHADTEYSTFLGERGLTDEEIQLIADWVDGGMLQGDPNLEAEMPNFPEGSLIGEPDFVLTMEEEYLVEGNNQDDYRVFVLSTDFGEDKYLQSIEIVPGNLAAVHHVLVNIDPNGLCAAEDAATPEYGYECESGFCVGGIPQLATGYAPGTIPPHWTEDVGLVLPQGADIAIQMHYAPSSIDEYDQTSVNLFFKDEPVEREVQVETIIDPGLFIPANEIDTVYKSMNIDDEIGYDISLLSILPHMHLIGKSWLVYAEFNGDTIPIISIPDWDFNWQNFYQPEYMLKIPKEYTVHAYATYDNTSDNFANPNDPPQDMFWCDYTTCEMFFLPFSYVEYQEGDEDIYLGYENDIGCMDELACNYNSEAIIDDDSCDYSCYGCMDSTACNYNSNATIDDGNCGILDDCGVCHILCCYDLSTQICDYSVSQENCTDYWPSLEELSSDQNPYWNADCVYGCMDENACNYLAEAVFDDGTCDYSCILDCCDPCNFDPMCLELGLPECEDPECVGCMDPVACNYDPNATIPGSCEYETCAGCMDPVACNYDPNANNDDGSCTYPATYYDCNGDCLNDIDDDGICDEVECFTVLCLEFYECVLGDCVCINDVNGDGVCDDNVESCLDLDILSINQINPDQFSVTVTNNSSDNIFSYPGFVLFNEFGDTIAIEDVNYYGIGAQSVHILDIQENIEITNNLSLELYTWFYDYLLCEWDDLMISDNCDLEPYAGECDGAIPIYYFNQDNNQCEETWWGGCNGVVPFWNLEDCQNSCQSILIPEIESNTDVIKKLDVLGREVHIDKGVVIKIYDDGSVEKELILIK